MASRGMMSVDNKSASFPRYGGGRRFRRFVEAAFARVVFQLFRRFVGPGGRQVFLRCARSFPGRVNRRRICGHCFPGVSTLRETLRDGLEIELLWTLQRIQLFP